MDFVEASPEDGGENQEEGRLAAAPALAEAGGAHGRKAGQEEVARMLDLVEAGEA